MKSMESLIFKNFWVLPTLSLMHAFSATPVFAAADAYPNKPVRLIIPYAPGGTNDIIGRLINTKLAERIGKPVVVDNRGGAGSVIGTDMVAKAAPDGYTLLCAGPSVVVQPAVQKVPYDPVKSFAPVAGVATSPYLLLVNPSVPANTVKEFIALAKQKPGNFIFGAPGVGTALHLMAELIEIKAAIDFNIVQFKGTGPIMSDLLGGHSHVTLAALTQALPHIKSGKIRVLGTGGKERSVVLPDVPTISEAGLSGYTATGWWGIIAPAGTPLSVLDRLNRELKSILSSDDVKKMLLNDGIEANYVGRSEFGRFLENEITTWKDVVKKANIKLEQ